MFNLVITFEKGNLNSLIDSFGAGNQSLFVTENESGKIVDAVFRELYVKNRARSSGLMFSASRNGIRHFFHLNDIYYFESYGNLKSISGSGEPFEFYGVMDKIESSMKRFGFLRIHKSYIISLRHIRKASARMVVMTDGKIINIGRKYIPAYREAVRRTGIFRL